MRYKMILGPGNYNGELNDGVAGFTGNAYVAWRAEDSTMVAHCEHTTKEVFSEDGDPSYVEDLCDLTITEFGASCATCGLYLAGTVVVGEVAPRSDHIREERRLTELRLKG